MKFREEILIYISIILIVFMAFLILLPRIQTLSKKQEQLRSLSGKYNDVLYSKKADINEETLLDKLPRQHQITNFLTELETTAEQYNIKLLSIIPSDEYENDVKVLPVEFTFCGKYESLLELVKKLENHKRIIRIDKLTIDVLKSDAISQDADCNMSLVVNLFYYP